MAHHGDAGEPTPTGSAYSDFADGDHGPTYRNSNMLPRTPDSHGGRGSASGIDVFVRGSLQDRYIEAVPPTANAKIERARDYKGRIRTWPGLMVIMFLLGGCGFLATYYGMKAHNSSESRSNAYEKALFNSTTITGGGTKLGVGTDDADDDGVIGNPKKYPKSECELPDYQSKNGHIVAVSKNGTEVQMKIKGINWFGMETGQAAPFGLWENTQNGTTAYQITSFLSKNKFNAVRLPLMAASILSNREPNTYIINRSANRALDVRTYLSLLKGILKTLQFRHIGVLLSMHTLTNDDIGDLWFNDAFPEEKFLEAIDVLTKELCTNEYWNVMGLDLKNEPAKGTWGDGGPKDFRAGAKRIADRMLKGCPNWMGFVEGVNAQHSITIDGQEFGYYDWYGGGLHGAKTKGLEFSAPNKVVWAPHYYTPAVFPQYYLFGGGKVGEGNAINGYVELSDDKLRGRIKATMDDMFGFLASETGPALLLGEFGGLYAEDKHPMKTTQRCTDFTIEIIKKPGWAGGFVWSLNPESGYGYNPVDKPGHFTEGVLNTDWLSANPAFIKALQAMDDMEGLQPFPCFRKTKST